MDPLRAWMMLSDDGWLGLEARMLPEIPDKVQVRKTCHISQQSTTRQKHNAIRWCIGTFRHGGQSFARYHCPVHQVAVSTEAKRQRNTKQYEHRARLDQLLAA